MMHGLCLRTSWSSSAPEQLATAFVNLYRAPPVTRPSNWARARHPADDVPLGGLLAVVWFSIRRSGPQRRSEPRRSAMILPHWGAILTQDDVGAIRVQPSPYLCDNPRDVSAGLKLPTHWPRHESAKDGAVVTKRLDRLLICSRGPQARRPAARNRRRGGSRLLMDNARPIAGPRSGRAHLSDPGDAQAHRANACGGQPKRPSGLL